ncbi:hypothetical protein [Shinella sp.]|uniref:hypothetical protein n=1 Tax=Shinella sp. TaxID=1870904 RepID=UPI003D2C5F56
MPNKLVLVGENGTAYPLRPACGEKVAGRTDEGPFLRRGGGGPKYKPPVFSNDRKRRKTARMMLNRLTIDLRISGPAFRAL